jgi:hypothetical protein
MINKQRTSKAWSRSAALLLPLIALLLMAFGPKDEVVPPKQITPTKAYTNSLESVKQSTQESVEAPSILGAWKLVSYNYDCGDEMHAAPENIQSIKLITKDKFMCIHYTGVNRNIVYTMVGSYVLTGEDYTETAEYCGSSTAQFAGTSSSFKVQTKDNKLYLSGTLSFGLKIKEIWELTNLQ